VGTACSDAIACTSGDACDGSGACVGVAGSGCGSLECAGAEALPDIIDLGIAHVRGTIRLDGGALPSTRPDSNGDITLYAVARDTGARHTLGYIRYRYSGPGMYTLFGTDGTLSTRFLPGVYDILYRRGYDETNDYSYAMDATDPYVNGYRILRESVVLGPGDNLLDLDLRTARVGGTITLDGGALPSTRSDSTGDITFYAVARDTGARHTLGYIRYRYTGPGTYTLFGTDGTLDTRLLPGEYDILYRRGYDQSNDYTYETDASDPYVNGYRLLRAGVVLAAGDNTLNLDLGEARVAGTITLGGGPLPSTRPDSNGDITLYAVARDTGARHTLGYIRYRYSAPGTYTLFGTDGTLDTRVLPGEYDILYRRGYDQSNDYTYETAASDPYLNGYRLLRRSVTLAAGTNTLDLDLAERAVAASITLAGGPLPEERPSSNGDITLYAQAADTRARHTLGYIRYRYAGPARYTRFGTDGVLDTRLLPGPYHVVYRRGYDASSNYTYADEASDPYVNGYRILAACVAP